jgi:hypothetical protein
MTSKTIQNHIKKANVCFKQSNTLTKKGDHYVKLAYRQLLKEKYSPQDALKYLLKHVKASESTIYRNVSIEAKNQKAIELNSLKSKKLVANDTDSLESKPLVQVDNTGREHVTTPPPPEYTQEDFEEVDEDKIERSCFDCGKKMKLKILEQYIKHDLGTILLCPDCYPIRDKQEWEKQCAEERKEAEVIHPLIGYSYKIKGEKPDYEKSYEEHKQEQEERDKLWREYQKKTITDEFDTETELKSLTKPGKEIEYIESRKALQEITGSKNKIVNEPWKEMGISKTQYIKELRRKMKLHKEENKQSQADWNLKYYGSPIHLFKEELDMLHSECDCEGSKIRQGIYCDICRLIKPIYDITLKTFKEAAERRKT